MAKKKQTKTASKAVILAEQITRSILFIRKQKAILSSSLAELYESRTKSIGTSCQAQHRSVPIKQGATHEKSRQGSHLQ